MPHKTSLPHSPLSPQTREDDRLFAASAQRNCDPILRVILDYVGETGTGLEIASGTGEHICALAKALPKITWQPSDPDLQRRQSIAAHVSAEGLQNVRPALDLDAAQQGWAKIHGNNDLILLVNLLHLIPTHAAQAVISEAAQALSPTGIFFLYGPFLRDGRASSPGDAEFHRSLQDQNPEIGYKDIADVLRWLQNAGLTVGSPMAMPANNLFILSRQPG